jgi:ATP-dependent Clp protease ATP-binding subunit ClpC
MGEVKRLFNPEFLNRLDEVIVFHPLNRDHMRSIVAIMLNELRGRLDEHMLTLQFSEDAEHFLMEKGYDPSFGARPLRRTIQKYVEDPLVEGLLRQEFKKGDVINVDADQELELLTFKAAELEPEPEPAEVE